MCNDTDRQGLKGRQTEKYLPLCQKKKGKRKREKPLDTLPRIELSVFLITYKYLSTPKIFKRISLGIYQIWKLNMKI